MEKPRNIFETSVMFYRSAQNAAEQVLLDAGADGVQFSEVFGQCQAAANDQFPEIEYGPEEFEVTLGKVQQKHLGLFNSGDRLYILK